VEGNISKSFEPGKYENSIYKKWEDSGAFTPRIDPKKKPFTISMPPPNATGQLHLGHSMMLAIQDIMVRYHRMKGDSALWLPGTDHAAIATQNRVEREIAKKGLTRQELGRAKFLSEVKKFVKNSQSTIRQQIRKVGSSCDWTRERYTMDDMLSEAVTEIFVRMYEDGLIYRGNRIVNWCPRCHSTLADDEVEYKDEKGKLYWIKYGPFKLATTRPETKLGDTAVAVNPKDKRYKHMIGKKYMIPGVLGDFEVVVVGDDAVEIEFGSGAVKVTPAHSFVDFEIAKRHGIPAKKVINEEGKMMDNCGKYEGMTTEECRKEILKDMKKMGLLLKEEEYDHKLSVCYRCGTVIEPLTSEQWFVNVDKKGKSLKKKSLDVVKNKDIEIIPKRFEKTYYHWMENLHDWCISRQIWWGHRIPVWYCKCGEVIVAKKTPAKCPKCKNEKLKQDPDTLDTWFSSGLWTFSTLGWPKKTKDLEYFHPTAVLETGYDILFFWIARMILMTTYALDEIPFKHVFLHGMIRDKNGDKMSKSKPETCIDPLDMIAKYGADALRLSFIIGSTPGNDLRLYEEKIAGFRNFINKIWNASRYALMNVSEEDKKIKFTKKHIKTRADKWIVTRLQDLTKESTENLEKFNFSEAGLKIYDFLWGDLCDWYLEVTKGEHKNPVVLLYVLKNTLKLLHPFVPFVTEAIWESLENDKMLIVSTWPKYDKDLVFKKEEKEMELIHEVISAIRSVREGYKVKGSKKIQATIYAGTKEKALNAKKEPLMRLAGLEKVEIKAKGSKIKGAATAFLKGVEIYLPLEDLVDADKEKERIQGEIEYKQGFINQVNKKLKNKKFVDNAPVQIVEKEREKLEEAETTIKKLQKQLKEL
jgi:valyl-tRNA synthetase